MVTKMDFEIDNTASTAKGEGEPLPGQLFFCEAVSPFHPNSAQFGACETLAKRFESLAKSLSGFEPQDRVLAIGLASSGLVRRLAKRAADLPYREGSTSDPLWITRCLANEFAGLAFQSYSDKRVRPDALMRLALVMFELPAENPADIRVRVLCAYVRLARLAQPKERFNEAQ